MSVLAYALLAVGALHERQRTHPANPDGDLASPRELLTLLRAFALPTASGSLHDRGLSGFVT